MLDEMTWPKFEIFHFIENKNLIIGNEECWGNILDQFVASHYIIPFSMKTGPIF